MPVDISMWRARIGLFHKFVSHVKSNQVKFKNEYSVEFFFITTFILLWPLLLFFLLSIIFFLIWYVKFWFLKRFSKLVCIKNLRTFCIIAAIAADFSALSLLIIIAMVNQCVI